jgi:hypothetical protein
LTRSRTALAFDIINTDPARMTANTAAVETAAEASWFTYYGQDGCAEKDNLIGYLAALRRVGIGTVFPQWFGTERVGRARFVLASAVLAPHV